MTRGRSLLKGELKLLLRGREPQGCERAASRELQICTAESCRWEVGSVRPCAGDTAC